ncbi:hypothetical protein EDD15DRAFT_2363499 [Pisolithus albus]|nr:hypothetical protein EDD15DRAFT_2363499 [Pisolithus albus]
MSSSSATSAPLSHHDSQSPHPAVESGSGSQGFGGAEQPAPEPMFYPPPACMPALPENLWLQSLNQFSYMYHSLLSMQELNGIASKVKDFQMNYREFVMAIRALATIIVAENNGYSLLPFVHAEHFSEPLPRLTFITMNLALASFVCGFTMLKAPIPVGRPLKPVRLWGTMLAFAFPAILLFCSIVSFLVNLYIYVGRVYGRGQMAIGIALTVACYVPIAIYFVLTPPLQAWHFLEQMAGERQG